MQFSLNRYHHDNNKQKNLKSIKIRILRNLDLLLQIQHQELKVWCLANSLQEE